MAILFDISARSIVVHCTDCPARDIVTSVPAAERWGREHAISAHSGDRTARAALDQRRRRAALGQSA